MQIAKAVSYLSTRRLVHRDLKPANILIDAKELVRICDFGLARHISSVQKSTAVQTSAFGTPHYTAPECWEGVVRVRSDVYSFGCIMYALLTGKDPWDGLQVLQISKKHSKEERPSV